MCNFLFYSLCTTFSYFSLTLPKYVLNTDELKEALSMSLEKWFTNIKNTISTTILYLIETKNKKTLYQNPKKEEKS